MRRVLLLTIVTVLGFSLAVCQETAMADLDSLRPLSSKDRQVAKKTGVAGVMDDPAYYFELLLNLQRREDFEGLRKNGEILKSIYRQLSPASRKVLLNPKIMLIILGARHLYGQSGSGDKIDLKRFGQEMKTVKIEPGFHLLISDNYIIDAPYFLNRLMAEGKFLVGSGFINQEEFDLLSTGPFGLVKARLMVTILEDSAAHLAKGVTIRAFMTGYPIKYVQAMADIENAPAFVPIIESRYNMEILATREVRESAELIGQMWDAVLDYGYAVLSGEEGFNDTISKEAKASFDYRLNSVAPLAGFLSGLRGQSASADGIISSI